jgi:hypothetical protein
VNFSTSHGSRASIIRQIILIHPLIIIPQPASINENVILVNTDTRKLTNINININYKFQLVDYGELYQQNSLSLCLSVNTDKNILSVYNEESIMKKKAKSYNDSSFIQMELSMK